MKAIDEAPEVVLYLKLVVSTRYQRSTVVELTENSDCDECEATIGQMFGTAFRVFERGHLGDMVCGIGHMVNPEDGGDLIAMLGRLIQQASDNMNDPDAVIQVKAMEGT